MGREYEVEVVYRQRAVYRIEAADREEAETLAVEHWQSGAPGELPGYEWNEIEAVRAVDAATEEQQTQDAALVLRFLQEREQLLLRLGSEPFRPTSNDAISADRVAADLGWSRPGTRSGSGTDVLRAARALESLCMAHRLVCFQRTRVRTGERGEIRLYCTPEYLESLSSGLTELAEHPL
jgi:hypothetical protein